MNFVDKVFEMIVDSKHKYITIDQIYKIMGVRNNFDKQAVAAAVNELCKSGKLVKSAREKYTLSENTAIKKATIIGTTKGYAFAKVENETSDDFFIPERMLNGAVHGDTVLIKPLKTKKVKGNHKPQYSSSNEAEVIKIVSRGVTTLVGLLQENSGINVVIPDDKRITESIFIPIDKVHGATNNTKVVVKILEYPSRSRMAQGEIEEVIGDASNIKVSTLSIIRSFNLREEFSAIVENEAKKVAVPITDQDREGRTDFRNTLTITIDGEDARDFDDAINVERKGDNYRLYVHIADVSHYVKENGEIDKEAFHRGTSVYFPDMVLPMLPVELSNGMCSLNPNEERLTLSVVMDIDKQGNILNHKITKGIIKSDFRMTYTAVTKIFDGDKKLREKYKKIVPMLDNAAELAKILLKRRDDAGQLDFDLPETAVIVNDKYETVDIIKKPRNLSDRMIEQFMVVTNEVVAAHFSNLGVPFVYRVHEIPTMERIKAFKQFAASFSIKMSGGQKPKDFQKVLLESEDKEYSEAISKVMLRSMQKARYAPENLGHFGLALNDYCHFTSPIRRYPDLTIHRIIKKCIDDKLPSNKLALEAYVLEVSEQSSLTERVADEAERTVDDQKKAEFMAGKIGQVFEGKISGVTQGGVYVELDNTIEGFIYKEKLPRDNYVFDPVKFAMYGKNNQYRIGQRISVKLVMVDVITRHIDFEPNI